MKAIKILGERQMTVADIEQPVMKANEVLLRLNYVGFCGSDLNTYLEESLIKFLIGDLSLEDDWDGFIGTVEGMGLQSVVDIYQDAYDRYLAR